MFLALLFSTYLTSSGFEGNFYSIMILAEPNPPSRMAKIVIIQTIAVVSLPFNYYCLFLAFKVFTIATENRCN